MKSVLNFGFAVVASAVTVSASAALVCRDVGLQMSSIPLTVQQVSCADPATSVLAKLKSSEQFPDVVFSADVQRSGADGCNFAQDVHLYWAGFPVLANLGSTWTEENFYVVDPVAGAKNVAMEAEEFDVSFPLAQGSIPLGKIYTRNTLDFGTSAQINQPIQETLVVVGGTRLFDKARGSLHASIISGAVKGQVQIVRLTGKLCTQF